MAKNKLVSLCTSWSLRYPPCLISLITNKLAANSVTIADFIVIPTCFFSRREVEKWSTLRTRFFFLFVEGLSDLLSFAKLMIIDELELQGSMGLKTTPSRFETKVPWVPSLVLYSTLTQFFFSVIRLCQRELTYWWHKNERNNWYSPCMDLFMSPLYSKDLIR